MAFCSKCGVSLTGRFCQACGYDNQPNESAQNLNDTVGQLYSLRAGISLVAVQLDDIKKAQEKGNNQIEQKKQSIEDKIDRYEDNKADISGCHDKIQACKNTIEIAKENEKQKKVKKTIEEKERKHQELIKKSKKLKTKNIALRAVSISLFATGGVSTIPVIGFVGVLLSVIVIVTFLGNNGSGKWANLVKWADYVNHSAGLTLGMIAGIIVFAGITVATIVVGVVMTRKIKKINIEKELSWYDQKVNELNRLSDDSKSCEIAIVSLEKEIKKLEASNVALDEQRRIEEKSLAEFEKKHKAEIDYYQLCSNETYNSLVKEYSPLIDVRDWSNLDLVIYYLETGRAISIREALQLTDRQHQTDAIIHTFKVATEQIKETISMSSQRLEGVMLKCSSVISNQLDDVRGRLNSIEVNQDIANSHLRNISSEISVANALQAKANTTSERMMSDIRQMRVYADNSAIRARNS